MKRCLFYAVSLIALAGLPACERRPEAFARPTGSVGMTQPLTDDTSELLDGDALQGLETVFAWRTSSSRDVVPWTRHNPAEIFTFSENWLVLRSIPGVVGLVRPTDIAADSVQVIDVQIGEAADRIVQLAWTRDGEPFDDARRLEVLADHRPSETYSFGVGAHPLWSGRIDRLAINVLGEPGEEARLHSVVGRSPRSPPDTRRFSSDHSVRVQLDMDARLAIATADSDVFERQVRVPPDGRLRFAFAVAPRLLHPVRFVVSAARDGETPRAVADELLDPVHHDAFARWRDGEVDLAEFSGERVRLVLRTEDGAPAGGTNGVPLWANLALVTAAPDAARPNVVFISLDTLRADHMSLHGYERRTTPRIDAWARRRGVTFENAIVASPWTLPSHASMFSGLDCISHGVNYEKDRVPEDVTLIAERFRAEGYVTHAVTGGGFMNPQFGLAQGFDTYTSRRRRGVDPRSSEASLSRNLEDALTWLGEKRATPFFLFFHTYEIHDPFWARQPWFEEFGGDISDVPEGFRLSMDFSDEGRLGDLDLLASLYDSGIAFADEQIGRLLAELEALGLEQNTIVVLTSDHGESLGEHGLLGHGSLYEDNLRVPLVIAPAGPDRPGVRIDAQVRSVDIAPTLLELAGIPWDGDVDGTSLAPWMGGRAGRPPLEAWGYVPARDGGVSLRSDNRFKYIYSNAVTEDGSGAEQLYDLQEDPAELVNLARSSTLVDAWRVRAQQRLAHSTRGPRLHLTNGSDQPPYRGSIKGAVVRAPGVVAVDLPGPWVERTGSTTLRFTVPPGESITLVAENARAGDLQIRGETALATGTVPFLLSIDDFAPGSRHALSFDGTAWSELGGSDSVGNTAIIAAWDLGDDGPSFEPDDALLDQLRALGYVR